MKKNKTMIVLFLTPAIVMFCVVYLYPVIRTIIMSFYKMDGVVEPMKNWSFVGLGNYSKLFTTQNFKIAMTNAAKIWLVGGVVVLSISLLFAVILTSGVRFKNFFRAVIYLPNVVSAVALATMWIFYVFDQDFGFFRGFFSFLHLEKLADMNWLSSDMKFWAMLIAFCFGAVGYYMLIFLSGIERIPEDLYEAATLDGAGKVQQFFRVTLPLLKGVIKTNITFWSVSIVGFFVWSKMFSPIDTEASTLVPLIYVYDILFGRLGGTERNVGLGAAIGIIMSICVIVIFTISNYILKDDDLEF